MARSRIVTVLTALVLAAVAAAPGPVAASHPADALLPDLGMAPLQDFSIQKRPKGARWLRFSAVIVNVGAGPFQALGYQADSGDVEVDQQLRTASGSWSSHPTIAKMYFGGDGHNHWHVRDLERYELEGTNTGKLYGEKHGFCFYDNYNYTVATLGGPANPIYTSSNSCQTRNDDTVLMGLSRGWGDIYPYNITDQYINISSLPSGTYSVTARADWANWFTESNEDNNSTTAVIRISKNGVTVLDPGTGP